MTALSPSDAPAFAFVPPETWVQSDIRHRAEVYDSVIRYSKAMLTLMHALEFFTRGRDLEPADRDRLLRVAVGYQALLISLTERPFDPAQAMLLLEACSLAVGDPQLQPLMLPSHEEAAEFLDEDEMHGYMRALQSTATALVEASYAEARAVLSHRSWTGELDDAESLGELRRLYVWELA